MQLNTEVMLAKIKESQWALADIDWDAPGAHWNSGCKSRHLTEGGFNSTMYPGFAKQFKRQMRLNLNDYAIEKLPRKSSQPIAA